VEQYLVDWLHNDLEIEAIGRTDNLYTLGLNSLSIVKLSAQIDHEFGISLDDDDFTMDNFKSIRSIVRMVERRMEAATDQEEGEIIH